MKAYIATVQILLPGEIKSEAEACDSISACLSENLKYEGHILDWSYLPAHVVRGTKIEGPFAGPQETLVPNPWDDDQDLTQYNPLFITPPTPDRKAVHNYLDCSTANVSRSTGDWLDERGRETAGVGGKVRRCSHWVASTPYGWFIYADEEPSPDDFPPDLIEVMKHARSIGCSYIMFDRDAEKIDGLPSFDW